MSGARVDTSARIAQALASISIPVTDEVVSSLARYYDLLFRWNARINLTGLSDGEAALERLIVEPASAVAYLPPAARHLDVGSGGGSPAIPLNVLCAGWRSALVESRGRKVAFLREACRVVQTERLSVFQARLGEFENGELYDLVTVRAVRLDPSFLDCVRSLTSDDATLACFSSESASRLQGSQWALSRSVELVGSAFLHLYKPI